MVAISDNQERLVGQIAKRQAVTNPENTVFGIKRLIGRKYDSAEVQNDVTVLPYKIEKAANGDVGIRLREKLHSPAEISSFILANINRNVLLRDIPHYVAHLNKGGILILSGFYRDDLPMISEKFPPLGVRDL